MMAAPKRLHFYLVALGALGIAAIFLPFVEDVGPSDVIVEAARAIFAEGFARLNNESWLLTLLAAPFFLALPISVASVQQLWSGGLSRRAWVMSYVLALMVSGAALGFFGWGLFAEVLTLTSRGDYLILLLPLGTLLGAGWLIRNGRRGLPHALNAVIAMQVVYITNGIFCLALFFDGGWQSGAYMTLVTVLVYAAHIVLVSSMRPATPAQ